MPTRTRFAVIVLLCCAASFLLGWASSRYLTTTSAVTMDADPGKESPPVVVERRCKLALANEAELQVVNNKGELVLTVCSRPPGAPWHIVRYGDITVDAAPSKEFVPVVVNSFCTVALADNASLRVVNNKGKIVLAIRSRSPGAPWYMVLCDNVGRLVLDLSRYQNGCVEEVGIYTNNRLRHRWGFYPDGNFQFVSKPTFDPRFPAITTEVRQYYDHDGKPTRVETYKGICVD